MKDNVIKSNLNLIRRNFPSSIKDELLSVFPPHEEKEEYIDYSSCTLVMRITGGYGHDFYKGFYFEPYKLSLFKERRPKCVVNQTFYFCYVKLIETFEVINSEEEFTKIKSIWEERVKLFNNYR